MLGSSKLVHWHSKNSVFLSSNFSVEWNNFTRSFQKQLEVTWKVKKRNDACFFYISYTYLDIPISVEIPKTRFFRCCYIHYIFISIVAILIIFISKMIISKSILLVILASLTYRACFLVWSLWKDACNFAVLVCSAVANQYIQTPKIHGRFTQNLV